MIIPPIRWGDILLRSTDERSIAITEREQYLLYMLLSWVQMNPASFISDYAGYSSETINQFLDECMNNLFDETTPPAETHMQSRFDLFGYDAVRGVNDAGSSPVTLVLDGNQYLFHYVRQTPNAINDQVHFTCYMDSGDYDIRHSYVKVSFSGKLSIYIWKQFGDGAILTPVNQVDMYSAATSYNQIITGTFTLTEPGEYKVVMGVPAKNASASGYGHLWTKCLIRRTGSP